MTPTFEWDHVEGAASYRLQVDDDPLFGTPLLDVGVDGTSYTPQETAVGNSLSSHITYYWRVAIRRSDNVLGAWTPAMPLDKNSVTPVPLSPLTSNPPVLFTETPTFAWSAVLTPTASPRLAAPLYQLQVDNNLDFKSPEIDISTTADTYTPIKGKSLHRLLVISDSNKRYLDGNHANSALFWFHEIFHVMEWAYYKSPFPSAEHSYARRDAWPADYQGTTEWDFYRETYLKRFMPEDSLARFEWRSNHEGFYNRKVKGK